MPPSSETPESPASSAQRALVQPMPPARIYGSVMQLQSGSGLSAPNLTELLENAPFLTGDFLANFEGTIFRGQIFESYDRTQENRVFWRAKETFGSMPGIVTTVLPPWKNLSVWKEIYRCSGSTPPHKIHVYTVSMKKRRQRLFQSAISQNNGSKSYAPAAPSLRPAATASNQHSGIRQQPVLDSGSRGSRNLSVSSLHQAGSAEIQATWDRAMFITDDFIKHTILPLKAGYVFETWNQDANCRYLWRIQAEIHPSNPNKPLPRQNPDYWQFLDFQSGKPPAGKLQRYDAAVARGQMPVPYMLQTGNGSGGPGRQSLLETSSSQSRIASSQGRDVHQPSRRPGPMHTSTTRQLAVRQGTNPSDLENAWRSATYIDKGFLRYFRGCLTQGSYFESQTMSGKGKQRVRVLWAVARDIDTKSLPDGSIPLPWAAESLYWQELGRRPGTSDASKVASCKAATRSMIGRLVNAPSRPQHGGRATPIGVKTASPLTREQRLVLASTRPRGPLGSQNATGALKSSRSLGDVRAHNV